MKELDLLVPQGKKEDFDNIKKIIKEFEKNEVM